MRERNRPERDTAPSGATGFIDQRDVRTAAERLLSASGDIIDQALSQNSQAFLAANRQEGGQ